MPYPLSRKKKALPFIIAVILVTTKMDAISENVFLQSSYPGSHIYRNYPLYNNYSDIIWKRGKADTPGGKGIRPLDRHPFRYIRRAKNSDLVIAIPGAENRKYKVRFFDEEDRFLFEIRQIRDSLLIVEKFNFQHAGLFRYELYKGESLIERNTFLIKKDQE